jgi:hypothetical protein
LPGIIPQLIENALFYFPASHLKIEISAEGFIVTGYDSIEDVHEYFAGDKKKATLCCESQCLQTMRIVSTV